MTLPLIRPALLGGVVLVVLTVISEYGAFEIVRYQTFTTEIFTEFQFDSAAAGALSIPLVALGLLALMAEELVPRRAVFATAPPRAVTRVRLGRLAVPATLSLALLVAVGVGVPVGTIVYWIEQSQRTTLPATATLGSALGTTATYSAWGAALAVGLARSRGDAGLPAAHRHAYRDRAQHLCDQGGAGRGGRAQPRVLRHPLRVRAI